MTEKKFEDIEVSADLGLIRLYTSDEDYEDYNGDEVLNMLNELNYGKQYWKQVCHMIEDTYHDLQKKFHNWDIALSKCREENKQLKADNNRLVNETAKVVATHQRKVLDLIDKSLKKDKHYYKMSYEDYLNGRIEALEQLKKELTEQ